MNQTSQQKSDNIFSSLLFFSFLLTFLTVVLSAYIRLSVSGVGCSEWPACYGTAISNVEHRGVAVLTEVSAEMQHIGARVAHRIIASLLGLMVVVITFIAWRRRKTIHFSVLIPTALLGITIFLSVLGYLTPSPLVPIVTVMNLIGGMGMLAILWWMVQRSAKGSEQLEITNNKSLNRFVLLGILILSLQIVFGGWVSSNYAAASCPDIFGCGQSWSFNSALDGLNPQRELQTDSNNNVIMSDVMSSLHMIHRLWAGLTALYLIWLATSVIRKHQNLRPTGITILVLLVVQIALGLINVVSHMPLNLVTAHNMVAALLLLAVINLYHLVTPLNRYKDERQ
ncbi:MAG: COX15/CtaA family protein [Gammaproteobacteria bacterium]|nr:COX15/CtaA family protein [Gammaproteobacteria bacterium]